MNKESNTPAPAPVPTMAGTVALMREKFQQTMLTQLNEFDATAMAMEITSELNRCKREVVLTVLGLDSSFGGWRIDNKSPISAWLVGQVDAELKGWLLKAAKETLAKEMTKEKTEAKLRAAFLSHIKSSMEWGVDRAAQELANEMVQSAKQDLMDEFRK